MLVRMCYHLGPYIVKAPAAGSKALPHVQLRVFRANKCLAQRDACLQLTDEVAQTQLRFPELLIVMLVELDFSSRSIWMQLHPFGGVCRTP